jgi:hypothetical protein
MTLAVKDEPFIAFFTSCLKESSLFHAGRCFVVASSSNCDRPRLHSRCNTDLNTDRKTEPAVRANLIDGDFGKPIGIFIPESRAQLPIAECPRTRQHPTCNGKACELSRRL